MNVAGFASGILDGRVAVVTGAGSGIGRATATLLAELGASIAAIDLDHQSAEDTVTALTAGGGRGASFGCDLGRIGELPALVDRVTAALGTPSILVNNAGVIGQALLDTSIEDWERVMAVNVTAPFVLVQALGRRMADARSGGCIVNVSSSSAFRAVQTSGAYGVSKAALGALTRAAAWELGPHDINVNSVAPGVTRTAITARAFGEPTALDAAVKSGPLANLLGRVSEPEDVANVIAFLCLPASRQITGQVIHTSAGAVVCAG